MNDRRDRPVLMDGDDIDHLELDDDGDVVVTQFGKTVAWVSPRAVRRMAALLEQEPDGGTPPSMFTNVVNGPASHLRDGDVVLIGVGGDMPTTSAAMAKDTIQHALREDLGVDVTVRVLTHAEGLFQVLRCG